MRRHLGKMFLLSAALAVIVTCTASAGATVRRSSDPPTCTWGASSVTATVVNGEVVEATPQTSGCTSGP